MKKLSKLLFSLLSISILACTNGIQDPSETGKAAFDVLYNLHEKNLPQYRNELMNIEVLRKLAKDTVLTPSQQQRNSLSSISILEFNMLKADDYTELRSKGVEYSINWATIKYFDFIYELKEGNGSKRCKGKMYFKSNNTTFHIETMALFTHDGYQLLRLDNLSKVLP